MDIEEFEKQVQPSGKRSRLEPFRSQIFELKAKGYADWQVRSWLAANGLEISRQAVQQFYKKKPKAARVPAAVNTETTATALEGLPQKGEAQAPIIESANGNLKEAMRAKIDPNDFLE